MERRRFLGVAALAGLPDIVTGPPNEADEQTNGSTVRQAPVFEPLLADVPNHAFVEQSDEQGSIRVSAHPDPRERVAAQVVIRASGVKPASAWRPPKPARSGASFVWPQH